MKEIKLTQGKVALVDDSDFEWLNQWKWYAHKHRYTFYARRSVIIDGKKITIRMHREILGITGTNVLGDHKDHNGLNNQRSNLRTATVSQNNRNVKSHENTSSKYLGVHFVRRVTKGKTYEYWVARINNNRKRKTMGCFKTEDEAAVAYNKAAIEVHGEFANLNEVN